MEPLHPACAVALGYRYPGTASLEALTVAVESSLRGVARKHMDSFVAEVGSLDQGEWEELHTRTLDLSPAFVPYVGHVTWGENYRRGEFMADLKRDMARVGVDLGGELPDHIEPILRYIAEAAEPLADLVDELSGSVIKMQATLKTADKGNPYRHLVAATLAVVEDLKPVVIGLK